MVNTLLVIDDGENMEALLGRAAQLYMPDLKIIGAKTGAEGLGKARAAQPQAVVLDVKLPDVDGFEVCRQLRADPLTKNACIIMISGVAREPSDVVKGERAGADDYIFKPFNITDLLTRLEKLLKR